VLFAILFAQINYIQVYGATAIANNPANFRLIIQAYKVDRGAILARDLKTVLAGSRPTKGLLKYLRVYPNGPLYADITGYDSLVYGTSRLEASEDEFLAARSSDLLPSTIEDEILNRPKRGATVVTTIDPHLQQVVQQALAGRPGAAVALNPRTGEVLAMVTNPSYDPSQLSSHDPNAGETAAVQRHRPDLSARLDVQADRHRSGARERVHAVLHVPEPTGAQAAADHAPVPQLRRLALPRRQHDHPR